MNGPASLPVVQPQPSHVSYGVEVLQLFQAYTRDSYFTTFGVQAPAWDAQRLSKAWFDSSALSVAGRTADSNRLVAYKVLVEDGNGGLKFADMTLTVAEASTVNLPGAVTYAPYVIAPSGASRGPGAVISSALLSLESDARALMPELGGTDLVDQGDTSVFPATYAPDEPRRMWAFIDHNGHQVNVGALLQGKNAQGVGAPGKWDNSSGGAVWMPDPPAPTGLTDARPPWPVPVRELLANEELRPVLVGFGIPQTQVVRTDLEEQVMLKSGAFLESDRQMLSDILKAVTK